MSGWEIISVANSIAIFALWLSIKQLEDKNASRED